LQGALFYWSTKIVILIFDLLHVPEQERTMKKKLLALAVGSTVAAAPIVATQADVKVWGRLEVELVSLDGGEFDNYVQQGDGGGMSRIGVDASKDLGNGLKAIGRYAFKLNPSNGSQFDARDQYVGLKGGWGNVKLGRQAIPYKGYGGTKWDPWAATFMEARRSGGMSGDTTGHNGFTNDQISYNSPKFGAVKFSLSYIADETDLDEDDAGNGIGALNGTGIAAISGGFGPVEVIGAYSNFNRNQLDDIKQAKLGIRYKANGLTAAWQYEDVDRVGSIRVNGNRVGSVGAGKINFLNLGYKFGNTLVAGNYGKTDAANNGQDVDYFALGARYYFAKKVHAYLGYAETKTDTKYKMFGAGMRYDF
jgi:predicted porin